MTSDQLTEILNRNYDPISTDKVEKMSYLFEMYLSSAINDPAVPNSRSLRECYLASILALERLFDSSNAIEPKYRGQIIAHEYAKYFSLLAQKEVHIN